MTVDDVDSVDPARRAAMAVIATVALAACDRSGPATAVVRIATSHGTVAVRGPVADTNAARARGLQGRTTLGPGQGMAFVFDHPTNEAFWMKGMAIPLTVAFWDGNDRVVAIMDMAPCRSDRCRTY